MTVSVGIPQALSFYSYYPLWKTFLENIGAEVVLSRPTNREILEWGIRNTVTDACIPVKIIHGHVMDLKNRADYLFIPRLVSVDGRHTFCPKFLGLPDMIRFSGEKIPTIIDTSLNATRFSNGMFAFLSGVARKLGVRSVLKQMDALNRACHVQRIYQELLLMGFHPLAALPLMEAEEVFSASKGPPRFQDKKVAASAPVQGQDSRNELLRVALLGYPYLLYDPFLSSNLFQKLKDMGVDPITPERITPGQMRRASKTLPQGFFWHYSNRVTWSCLHILDNPGSVEGIIHVTAFACGPDAMVDKFLELQAKQAQLPFLILTIDEHTGEGGIRTRLEAFVDMLWARRENE